MTQTDIVANLRGSRLTRRPADARADYREPTLPFRPDLQGLRAIAVGLVVAEHAAPSLVPGGFIGVDLFFLISGFLITSLLLQERSTCNRISVTEFYARRVRRLLPAASVMILVTVAATYVLLGPSAGDRVAGDGQWAAGFVANIHFSLVESSAAGASLPPSPLYNLWSLGVEEQFYLVWPALFTLAIVIGGATRRRLSIVVVLAIIIISSLAWAIIQTPLNANWAYESPLTRAWQLAVGALLAVFVPAMGRISNGRVINSMALGSVIGITVCASAFGKHTPYPGWAALLPVASGALLIAAGSTAGGPTTERFLALRPMQWLGARSYSLYLWHWPFLALAGQHSGHHLSAATKIGLVVAAVIVADASYRILENPIRRSEYLRHRPRFTLAAGGALVAVTIGIAQLAIVIS